MLICHLPCHSFILETQTTLIKKSCSKKLTIIEVFIVLILLTTYQDQGPCLLIIPYILPLMALLPQTWQSSPTFSSVLCNPIAFHIVVTFNHAPFLKFQTQYMLIH